MLRDWGGGGHWWVQLGWGWRMRMRVAAAAGGFWGVVGAGLHGFRVVAW